MDLPPPLLLVAGQLVDATGGRYPDLDPSTGEIIGHAPQASVDDLDRAVLAARAAFETGRWRADPAFRVHCLRQFSDRIRAHAEQLRALLISECGVPVRLTHSIQLDACFAELDWLCTLLAGFDWEDRLPDAGFHGHRSGRLHLLEPVGVAGLLTPGNFPFALLAKRLFTALGAGNTVVLKPSPDGPGVALLLAALSLETDLPAGVLNVVTGADPAELGEMLCRHPGVDLISMTGSSAAGRRVAARCAETGKRCVRYLGGKSAHLILDDADLPDVLATGARVCFHAGQACTLYTRLLVPRPWYAEGVELLGEVFADIPFGDPRDPEVAMGPLVNARLRDGFLAEVGAVAHGGGRVVVGGGVPAGYPRGFFVEPTVVADLSPEARLARDEVPGPVLCVLPYDTVDEAVHIANASPYGLAAAVTSGSVERAAEVARRLRAAAVSVNDGLPHGPDSPYQAFGESGDGHSGGAAAVLDYLTSKVVGYPAAD